MFIYMKKFTKPTCQLKINIMYTTLYKCLYDKGSVPIYIK